MSMVSCCGCGKELHQTALACPSCGAPQGETKYEEKMLPTPRMTKCRGSEKAGS